MYKQFKPGEKAAGAEAVESARLYIADTHFAFWRRSALCGDESKAWAVSPLSLFKQLGV